MNDLALIFPIVFPILIPGVFILIAIVWIVLASKKKG